MKLKINVALSYSVAQPTDILTQFRVAPMADQVILAEDLTIPTADHSADVPAESGIGVRTWSRVSERFDSSYAVTVDVDRPTYPLEPLSAVPPHQLPGDVVRYLMPSRYCPADLFQSFVAAEFGYLSGGTQVAAMRDWIRYRLAYVSGISTGQTTALESFVQRQGVCRDFAHLFITFCRAAAIPARFVSVYAPRVLPQDFHAVAEAYLDGAWHLVDPTGMAEPHEMARIGVGLDAAEVAFLSSFGFAQKQVQTVEVQVV